MRFVAAQTVVALVAAWTGTTETLIYSAFDPQCLGAPLNRTVSGNVTVTNAIVSRPTGTQTNTERSPAPGAPAPSI